MSTNPTRSKHVYLSLPVKNVEASKAFFSKLGFEFNPNFSDETSACLIITPDQVFAMLTEESKFAGFTNKPVSDAKAATQVLIALEFESKEKVDSIVADALAAGGSLFNEPTDMGWMYYHGFEDLDGHQWEVSYMDLSAIPAEEPQA